MLEAIIVFIMAVAAFVMAQNYKKEKSVRERRLKQIRERLLEKARETKVESSGNNDN